MKKRLLKKAVIYFLIILGIDVSVDAFWNFFPNSNDPLLSVSNLIIIFLVVVVMVGTGAIKVEKKV